MNGSGAVSCSCSLLIRGPILPAVRQKLHLSPCADSRSRLSCPSRVNPVVSVSRSAAGSRAVITRHTALDVYALSRAHAARLGLRGFGGVDLPGAAESA